MERRKFTREFKLEAVRLNPYGQNIDPGSDSLLWRENSLLPRNFSLIPSKNSLFPCVGNSTASH